MKTVLSLVTLVLSISATSLSAQAFCGQVGIYFVCRRLVPVLVGGDANFGWRCRYRVSRTVDRCG